MKVKSRVVQLHAFSIPGHKLPTFSKAIVKTVYNWWGWPIRRYCLFTAIDHILFTAHTRRLFLDKDYGYQRNLYEEKPIYKKLYIRIK